MKRKEATILSSLFNDKETKGVVYVSVKIGREKFRIKGIPEPREARNPELPLITMLARGGVIFTPEAEEKFAEAAYLLVRQDQEFYTEFDPDWQGIGLIRWKMAYSPE